MGTRQVLLERINSGPPIFGKNYGVFYPIRPGVIAKVFTQFSFLDHLTDVPFAQTEFDILDKLYNLDPRLRVPKPEDLLLDLMHSSQLSDKLLQFNYDSNGVSEDAPIHAVLMEQFYAPTVDQIPVYIRWQKITQPLSQMVNALLEHSIYKFDIKANEIFWFGKNQACGLIDYHMAKLGEIPDLDDYKEHLELRNLLLN